MARTEEHQRGSTVYWFSELLLMIFEKLFTIHGPTVQTSEEETEVLTVEQMKSIKQYPSILVTTDELERYKTIFS